MRLEHVVTGGIVEWEKKCYAINGKAQVVSILFIKRFESHFE